MAVNIELMNATESSATWRIFGDFGTPTELVIIGQSHFADLPKGRLKTALMTPVGFGDQETLIMDRMSALGFTASASWSGSPLFLEGAPLGELNGCLVSVDPPTTMPQLDVSVNGTFVYPDGTPRSNTFVTVFIRYSASE